MAEAAIRRLQPSPEFPAGLPLPLPVAQEAARRGLIERRQLDGGRGTGWFLAGPDEDGMKASAVALRALAENSEAHKRELIRLLTRLNTQRRWLEEHGRNLSGYVARYKSNTEPNHYGEGGEAIYAADLADLHEREQALKAERDHYR